MLICDPLTMRQHLGCCKAWMRTNMSRICMYAKHPRSQHSRSFFAFVEDETSASVLNYEVFCARKLAKVVTCLLRLAQAIPLDHLQQKVENASASRILPRCLVIGGCTSKTDLKPEDKDREWEWHFSIASVTVVTCSQPFVVFLCVVVRCPLLKTQSSPTVKRNEIWKVYLSDFYCWLID